MPDLFLAKPQKATVLPGDGRPDPEGKPYRPIGRILEAWQAREPEVVLEGPADTGKSRGWLEYLHACMLKYPQAKGVMIRKTRASMTSTCMDTYERLVVPRGSVRLWHDSEYRYANGSKIIIFGCEDPERLKSLEADVIYVQEASELEEEDWEILTTRVTGRGAVMPYVRLVADMNPVDPNFWLYKREVAGKVRFIQARHEDNPSITPQRIEALDRLTGYRYKRLRMGLRVAAEGMYFDEWDPEVHVVDEVALRPEWPRWTATDWGFADPFCTLWFARADDLRRTIYVYRERYGSGYYEDEQARMILRAEDPSERIVTRVGDPSMFNERKAHKQDSLAAAYEEAGVTLERATNARVAGWNAVRRALGRPGEDSRLRVLRSACPNLIRTLPTMVRDPLDPEDVAEYTRTTPGKKLKAEDHAADALRYGIMAEEGMQRDMDLARAMRHGYAMEVRTPTVPRDPTPQDKAERKPFYE